MDCCNLKMKGLKVVSLEVLKLEKISFHVPKPTMSHLFCHVDQCHIRPLRTAISTLIKRKTTFWGKWKFVCCLIFLFSQYVKGDMCTRSHNKVGSYSSIA